MWWQDEQEDATTTPPAGRTTRSTAVNIVASLNARSLGNAPLPEPKEHGKTMAQVRRSSTWSSLWAPAV